jgi:hypothetical protein
MSCGKLFCDNHGKHYAGMFACPSCLARGRRDVMGKAREGGSVITHIRPQRITHMLVLIDRRPVKGEAAFVQGMLGWLYDGRGQPYSRLVDAQTKMHVMIVGPEDFSESFIANMALVHFPALWNHTPVLNKIIYQRFNGPEGRGTTIEVRE